MSKTHDIGIFGFWGGANYGSLLNGYAMYKTLKGLGKKVLMIQKPDGEPDYGHNSRFVRTYYDPEDICPIVPYSDLASLNDRCDTFCTGSDQTWNYGLSFKENLYLPFVNDDKRIISFASSFGHKYDSVPKEARVRVGYYLDRYDAISVREKFAIDILKKNYGVKADLVIEPVFVLDKKSYTALANDSSFEESEPYLLTYILDPTPEKRDLILYYQEKLGLKVINILNGVGSLWNSNNKELNLPNTLHDVGAEDFIKAFMNCSFVITDAFHGTAFSIIWNKPFVSIGNYSRGFERFIDILERLDLRNRFVENIETQGKDKHLLLPIDYSNTNRLVQIERERTLEWLQNALYEPIKKKPSPLKKNINLSFKPSMDYERTKMLASLMRDYGIKHVVLSSGTRHINLVRFFEHNDCFITHNVVDERSAGFFAIGLSTKLNEPVALCCTSGTSVANYMSAVTEAYHQEVPLVVITADRYPCYLGQTEDQTIQQAGIFKDVCKHSVSLPVNDSRLGTWEARRLICETLLEFNHRGKGPVHINIPIITLERNSPPNEHLKLGDYKRIYRRTAVESKSNWNTWSHILKKSSKILIIYGQNKALSNEERKSIVDFSNKYNCVIDVDNLGNFTSDKTIKPLNMLWRISQKEFDEKLAPDVVITVGGRRGSRDPIIEKLRHSSKYFKLWRINESGKVADLFYKLTTIFECSQEHFFSYFANTAGSIQNNNEYLNAWKEEMKKDPPVTEKYSQSYVIGKTLENLPKSSLLHVAMSNTLRFVNTFDLRSDIEAYCNLGTNGIDGSASAFMGQVAASPTNQPCFLLIGDLSFFYDMNSIWNKKLGGNVRILLTNNSGAGLLKHLESEAIAYEHNSRAEGWVRSLGFSYLSAKNKEEFNDKLSMFVSEKSDQPVFFEVFV